MKTTIFVILVFCIDIELDSVKSLKQIQLIRIGDFGSSDWIPWNENK